MQDGEPQFGTWSSYSGADSLALALLLLVAAVAVAYLSTRLKAPQAARRPGRAITTLIVVLWLLSILTLLVCAGVEGQQALTAYPGYFSAVPVDPISPVTDTLVVVTFVTVFTVVFYRPGGGLRVAFASAAMASAAAPMLFELPFDLVVMGRTYPPIPPDPTLYRLLFFLPLFLVEVSTFAVLALTPMVRMTRPMLVALAAMLLVFAAWAALFGFAYPSSTGPYALNITSKVLAFAAVIAMFLPEGWRRARSAVSEGGVPPREERVGL